MIYVIPKGWIGGNMEAYQERVIAERDELAEKITKLESFLSGPTFITLSIYERGRLRRQSAHMFSYLTVLNERIENFPK